MAPVSDIPADFETARAESEQLADLIDRARLAYYGDGDTPYSDAEYDLAFHRLEVGQEHVPGTARGEGNGGAQPHGQIRVAHRVFLAKDHETLRAGSHHQVAGLVDPQRQVVHHRCRRDTQRLRGGAAVCQLQDVIGDAVARALRIFLQPVALFHDDDDAEQLAHPSLQPGRDFRNSETGFALGQEFDDVHALFKGGGGVAAARRRVGVAGFAARHALDPIGLPVPRRCVWRGAHARRRRRPCKRPGR